MFFQIYTNRQQGRIIHYMWPLPAPRACVYMLALCALLCECLKGPLCCSDGGRAMFMVTSLCIHACGTVCFATGVVKRDCWLCIVNACVGYLCVVTLNEVWMRSSMDEDCRVSIAFRCHSKVSGFEIRFDSDFLSNMLLIFVHDFTTWRFLFN